MKELINVALLLFGISVSVLCQRVKPLTIGTTLPNLEIHNIVNYKSAKVSTADLKGKLVIFDFWATWCSPCIAAFPKLDSLQKKFSGKIEILPVSTESKSVVTDFLVKMKNIKKVSPPSVTNDETLSKLFPHTYLPHYVWINDNGVVVAITGANEVTEANINSILKGNTPALTVKQDLENYIHTDKKGDYALFAPSILVRKDGTETLQNVPANEVKLYSSLTGYSKGLYSGASFPDSGVVQILNMTIRNLFRTAFGGNNVQGFNSNTLVIEIPDSSIYYKITTYRRSSNTEFLDWLKDNGYCYVIKTPPFLASKKYEIMLRDFNNYFGALYGIEGRSELRESKYLALERINQEDKFVSKGGIPNAVADKLSLRLTNTTFASLISHLALPLQSEPLMFDETGYTGKIDLVLNCSLSDLNAVNKELNRYGLQLTEKKKLMQVGVIGMKK